METSQTIKISAAQSICHPFVSFSIIVSLVFFIDSSSSINFYYIPFLISALILLKLCWKILCLCCWFMYLMGSNAYYFNQYLEYVVKRIYLIMLNWFLKLQRLLLMFISLFIFPYKLMRINFNPSQWNAISALCSQVDYEFTTHTLKKKVRQAGPLTREPVRAGP